MIGKANFSFSHWNKNMKKCYYGVLAASLSMLVLLKYGILKNPVERNYAVSLLVNGSNPLEWVSSTMPSVLQKREDAPPAEPIEAIAPSLFAQRNLSEEEMRPLKTWALSKHLVERVQAFAGGVEAIKEAGSAWSMLMQSIERERDDHANETLAKKGKEKQCPHYLSNVSATKLNSSEFEMQFPCGLIQDSSITIIGIPGLVGDFRMDLTGETLPEEGDPPIILHYNVRINGDKVTDDPVIVQNTWSAAHNWGDEERCPSPVPQNTKKVDELERCSKIVGYEAPIPTISSKGNASSSPKNVKTRRYFPFKEKQLSVATLRVGSEGFQMTVDGKHITSFAFRGTMEPWLVSKLRISGDLKLTSVVASGLPSSDESEQVFDVESLKASPLPQKETFLFIGVISTASNFKRRMAVRRTWMQFPDVRKGISAVRFFVGLHKNQIVNEELWKEAKTHGDIQLMPFVDYYNLITMKTLAICIFGTEVAAAKFVMKTDDDAFVRVDEVVNSLKKMSVKQGLLYGLINSDSHPHRNPDSKWFISNEEWPDDNYPPWAHGPGYVVSHDIARAVYKKLKNGTLMMFKLEDVAMGIWISELRKEGMEVTYEKETRVYIEGCSDGFVIAHYQGSREMLCLWQKLQDGKAGECCS